MNTGTCKCCGSTKVNLFTRITGYFSVLTSWNKSKKEELKARRKGNYKVA